jgi:hypothetical protein
MLPTSLIGGHRIPIQSVTVIEHRRVAGYRPSLDSPASARASVILAARLASGTLVNEIIEAFGQ